MNPLRHPLAERVLEPVVGADRTCRHCGQPIHMIPFGDGLWIHHRGEPDQSALCDDGHLVLLGVMHTAAPRRWRLILERIR